MRMFHLSDKLSRLRKNKQTTLGITTQALKMQRCWVDADLTDEERTRFLKAKLSVDIIDYELLERKHQRVLLQAFGWQKQDLKNALKKATFKPRYIETIWHSLGRGLMHHYALTELFQCVVMDTDYVVVTVHEGGRLRYFMSEQVAGVGAIRRSLQYYRCSPDRVAFQRCFYFNCTNAKALDDIDNDSFDVRPVRLDKTTFDALVELGLARRGRND